MPLTKVQYWGRSRPEQILDKAGGNPQGWDSALTVLVPRKEKSLKRCQEQEECLVAFPQVYLLSLKNELKTPHKLP